MATPAKRVVKKPAPSRSKAAKPAAGDGAAKAAPTRGKKAKARGEPGAGCARHRRVAHQGQDHRQVPRRRLRREGHRGHLRDLPTRELGVDVERGFEPKYVTIKGKTKTLAELKKAAKSAATIYLATDPDREGEAIAWHVADQINSQVPAHRVLFHEITKDAVHAAMDAPSEDRRAQGRRAAGPPDPRPAGGLQGQPDPLADASRPASPPAGSRPWRCGSSSSASGRSAPSRRRSTGPSRRCCEGRARPSRPRWSRWTGTSRSSTNRGRRPRGGGRGPEPCRSSSPRSSSAAARTPAARSPPARCSRRRPRSSASAPGGPCARRRTSTRASTWARRGRSA